MEEEQGSVYIYWTSFEPDTVDDKILSVCYSAIVPDNLSSIYI